MPHPTIRYCIQRGLGPTHGLQNTSNGADLKNLGLVENGRVEVGMNERGQGITCLVCLPHRHVWCHTFEHRILPTPFTHLTGATHVQLGLSSQLLEDNRYPGLLEDRRVLLPGSSLQLKRSSLSLELRISYSSGCSNSNSSTPIRNPSCKTVPHQLNSFVHHGQVVGKSRVPRHGADAPASETPSCSSSLQGVSRSVDGLIPQECDSAAGCGDAVAAHLAGEIVPRVKSRQTRGARGGFQAEGVLLVQACSSGVPVHRCDS